MYENAAMLAMFLLIYSAIAGRIERSVISGPIVFTAVGFILGADGLGVLRIHIDGEGLRLLAELTLAMVLFTDAANADFSIVKRNLGLPERLLLIGLPLTIVLGFLFAAVVLPGLAILEIALLAAMLAPTDAALGKPVVTNPTVPAAMREALNLESGSTVSACRLSCCCSDWRSAPDRGRDCGACCPKAGGRSHCEEVLFGGHRLVKPQAREYHLQCELPHISPPMTELLYRIMGGLVVHEKSRLALSRTVLST